MHDQLSHGYVNFNRTFVSSPLSVFLLRHDISEPYTLAILKQTPPQSRSMERNSFTAAMLESRAPSR